MKQESIGAIAWAQFDQAQEWSLERFTKKHDGLCDGELVCDIVREARPRSLSGREALPATLICKRCGAEYSTAIPAQDLPNAGQGPRVDVVWFAKMTAGRR